MLVQEDHQGLEHPIRMEPHNMNILNRGMQNQPTLTAVLCYKSGLMFNL